MDPNMGVVVVLMVYPSFLELASIRCFKISRYTSQGKDILLT